MEFGPSENPQPLRRKPEQMRDGMTWHIWKEGSALPGLGGLLPPQGAGGAGGSGRGGVRQGNHKHGSRAGAVGLQGSGFRTCLCPR